LLTAELRADARAYRSGSVIPIGSRCIPVHCR